MLETICLNCPSVYIVTGKTDMRRGIDRLTEIILSNFELNPFSKDLFLFCGHNRSKIKGLMWDGSGFLMIYYRLDTGVFKWPRNESEARLLSKQQIRWLLEGLEIDQPKAIKQRKNLVLY